ASLPRQHVGRCCEPGKSRRCGSDLLLWIRGRDAARDEWHSSAFLAAIEHGEHGCSGDRGSVGTGAVCGSGAGFCRTLPGECRGPCWRNARHSSSAHAQRRRPTQPPGHYGCALSYPCIKAITTNFFVAFSANWKGYAGHNPCIGSTTAFI